MIEFSREEKEVLVEKLKTYFQDELDQEIGGFDAEFLLDFFSREMGAYFYNRALADVQSMLEEKMLTINDALYEMEQIIPR